MLDKKQFVEICTYDTGINCKLIHFINTDYIINIVQRIPPYEDGDRDGDYLYNYCVIVQHGSNIKHFYIDQVQYEYLVNSGVLGSVMDDELD